MGRKTAGLVPTLIDWADRHPWPAVFLLSIALHANCVWNGIVWDDRAAVTYNRGMFNHQPVARNVVPTPKEPKKKPEKKSDVSEAGKEKSDVSEAGNTSADSKDRKSVV